ncbi:hypothetical protein M0P28_04830 [Streptococcus pasteurianus]|uniref:hypothetical protein n=1 Tax=Streptococcus TaxID=1301 RepID=UPI000E3F399D|nr:MULTISPECIES: hypothetical protein [Streptococcus]MCI7516339.1 hypothetical protein [Streptococcus sp.]MCO7183478.1 hypothetical protein [Streptococcus gallolyticus]MDV5118279.1 hypothetical protein [Streptococcus pasteurianus]MDV5156122.1 hypothetical protein [Streptococcus pasteurianus]MDV5164982.1 hypothetical protein [Streptococcus pasteurianus]
MENTNSNNHRLLIQKLLVSIHYLTLFRDEIVLVEKTPSLLGASFSPYVVQSELGEILAAVDALSKQEKLIKSTFWYDEASFRLMNHSLDIVGNWIRGIDNVLEICESKSVFQAILGDKRQRVFGVLIDVFTSIRITNLSIKEESEYPILVDPLQAVEYQKRETKKAELLAKIDALTPRKSEQSLEVDKDVQDVPILENKEAELAAEPQSVEPEVDEEEPSDDVEEEVAGVQAEVEDATELIAEVEEESKETESISHAPLATLFDEDESEMELTEISREAAIKQFRHYLFDHKGMIYVADAQDDLKREIKFYNAFDRFEGAFDEISDILVLMEKILEDLEERDEETFDDEGNLTSEPTEPIYLLIYGQNLLMEDSRFESLLLELQHFSNRSDLHISAYKAYE